MRSRTRKGWKIFSTKLSKGFLRSLKAGWPVASYHDYAEAHLGKNPQGQMSVTRIDLNPVVRFDTGFTVDTDELAQMQHRAHRYCFIANTLADSVEINVR